MDEGEVDSIDEDWGEMTQVRLSDVEVPFKLEDRNSRLAPLDSLIQEYTFHGKMISQQWGVTEAMIIGIGTLSICLLYTSPSPRDQRGSRMPSSA